MNKFSKIKINRLFTDTPGNKMKSKVHLIKCSRMILTLKIQLKLNSSVSISQKSLLNNKKL